MKPLISAFAIVTGGLLATTPVLADQVCMNADEMKAALIDWYGERAIAEPDENNRQIWASNTTGTWTMIRTFSDGSACVLAQGENWIPGVRQDLLVAELTE